MKRAEQDLRRNLGFFPRCSAKDIISGNISAKVPKNLNFNKVLRYSHSRFPSYFLYPPDSVVVDIDVMAPTVVSSVSGIIAGGCVISVLSAGGASVGVEIAEPGSGLIAPGSEVPLSVEVAASTLADG